MPNVHVIPAEWEWDPLAIEYADFYGIPYEVVEAAASNPTTSEYDPHSAEVGWEIRRNRRGDVVAVVGYRDPTNPVILHCRIMLPFQAQRQERTRAAGAGGGSTEPTTMRQLRSAIVARGYAIRTGANHDRVTTREGDYLCSLPISPSDGRSIPNAWHTFLRAADSYRVKKRVERGNLLAREPEPE